MPERLDAATGDEHSNVVYIDRWQRDKQLKEELRLIEASRPIEVPQYVKDEIVSIKALAKRRSMRIIHEEIIDEVPKSTDDNVASTAPEFYYDK